MKNKALFLDRDGVINHDFGYVHDEENFKFIDGIFEVVRAAISAGYKIFVVTNQAGIARGYYDELQFQKLTLWMVEEFKSRGCSIDKVYHSPYHPTDGVGNYKQDHYSRKPNPGMIFQARDDFDIDLDSSIIIGDNETDVIAGVRAGVGTLILLSQAGISPEHAALLQDCIVISQLDFAKTIILEDVE